MESLEPNQNQYDNYEFWVDDYDYLFESSQGCLCVISGDGVQPSLQLRFRDLFGDSRSLKLFSTILTHVRETNSTITFPYRCDSDTSTYYYRVHVSNSNRKFVVFASDLLDKDRRPGGVIWTKNFNSESLEEPSYPVCSVCGRIDLMDEWFEFQQLVDDKRWPASGKTMQCKHGLCDFCENAVLQRITDATMHIDQLEACA